MGRLPLFPEKLAFPKSHVTQQRAKTAFLNKAKALFNAIAKDYGGAALDIAKQALEEYPDQPKKAKQFWKEEVLKDPAVLAFLKHCDPSGARQKALLEKVYKASWGIKSPEVIWRSLKTELDKTFISRTQEESRKSLLTSGIPPQLIEKFLPKPFSLEIAPDGTLIKEFSIFGNKKKTIERKSRDMARILERWNELMDQLNSDLVSANPRIRLAAIISSIMLNTGIRPSAGGKSRMRDPQTGKPMRDEKGNWVYMKTFGATSLRIEHINFIRDDFVRLEFPGKAATVNVAELTDKNLVQAIKMQIEAAKTKDPNGLAFVTEEGDKITPLQINKYLKRLLGPTISATDFRKLKATETVYAQLRAEEKTLAKDLKLLKKESLEVMTEKIVAAIEERLQAAVEAAATAISHKSVKVTVESYIGPRVVLKFLTDGGLRPALSEIIGSGKSIRVHFDAREFFEKITGMKLNTATLRVLASLFAPGKPFVDYDIDATIQSLESVPSEEALAEESPYPVE